MQTADELSILFLLSLFSFEVTCKPSAAGFHDVKLYACIYQNGICDYNKITYPLPNNMTLII